MIATILLFGLPSVVLGSVLGRCALEGPPDREPRRTAGAALAISTAGSIAGTFPTSFFWLIPELGTDQALASAAIALVLAAAAVALVERLVAAFALAPTVAE